MLDGVDTATLGLRQLRSAMAMIPQDPFMFAGTVRLNLDPFNNHKDDELWAALEKARKSFDFFLTKDCGLLPGTTASSMLKVVCQH